MSWSCEQTEARLSDYLDGVLNPSELAEFSAHVPSCARCAPLVASVSDLLTGLHGRERLQQEPHTALLDSVAELPCWMEGLRSDGRNSATAGHAQQCARHTG